ncbi:hypothetical protein ACWDTP_05060 [Mycobacterium sp. NPDC003449]
MVECKTCTVETDNPDGVCSFCEDYAPPDWLAKAQAAHEQLQRDHAHVALPPHTTVVGEWTAGSAFGPFRLFTADSWAIPTQCCETYGWEIGGDDIEVSVQGIQTLATGEPRIKSWVMIGDQLVPIETVPELVRTLQAAYLAVIDAAREELSTNAPIFSEATR